MKLKTFLNNIIAIVIILLIASNFVFFRSYKNQKENNKVLVAKVDSADKQMTDLMLKMDSISKLPPDTVYAEPVIVKEKDTMEEERVYGEVKKETKIYNDSLVNDLIDVHVEVAAVDLSHIKFNYKAIYKYQNVFIKEKVPTPIYLEKPVIVKQRGVFINVGLGYSNDFSAKVGITFLDRKSNIYSYDFIRFGKTNIHMISYGIRPW